MVLVVMAAALPAAYAEILVLDELRAGDSQALDMMSDVASFESDGHAYLLAVSISGTVQIINATDLQNPVQAGDAMRIGSADSWFWDVEVFSPPDGRIYAVVAGDGARILDVTDPTGPALVDVVQNGATVLSTARDIEILERPDGRVHALVMGGNGRLQTVDVTDPSRPAGLGNPLGLGLGLTTPDSGGVVFSGLDGRTYALYPSLMAGVLVVDVTDPLRPALVSAVRYDDDRSPWPDDPFEAFGITLPSSSDVLISDMYAAGLRHPGSVAVFGSPDGRTYAMVANNGFTSNVNDSDPRSTPTGMLFLDVTDPESPVPVGAVRNGEGGFIFGSHIREITILDSPGGRVHMVVAGGQDAVILDVTDPARPVPTGHIRDGEGGFDAVNLVFGMAVVGPPGDRTYLAMVGDEGVQVADVTDPLAPTAAGSIPDGSTGLADLAVFEPGDGRTYILGVGGDGISVVDVTDRPVPAVRIQDGEGGFDTLDEARQVEVFHTIGGLTYGIAGGDDGLQVVNITDPAEIVAVGSLRDGEGGFDVEWITGMAAFQPSGGRDYVLVAEHNSGIHVVDVTDPDAPVLAGGLRAGMDGFDLLGGAHDIAVFDAYGGQPYALMTGDWGIHTIDMSRPGEPRVAGTLKDGMEGYAQLAAHDAVVFEASGGRPYALVADYAVGLHVIDVADPRAPIRVGSVPAEAELGMLVPGSDISTVASPDGHTYALAASEDSIRVVDVTDPRAPALVDGIDLTLSPWYVTVFGRDGGRAHALAGDENHMLVLDVTYPHAPVPVSAAGGFDGRGGAVFAPEGGRVLALVGSGDHTVLTVDLTDPRAPKVLGAMPAGNDWPGDVVAAGSPDGRAYGMWIGSSGGVLAADITEPHAATTSAISEDLGLAPGSAMELFRPHDGRTYMMAGSGDTIRIIDVTHPSGPAYVGTIRDNLGGFYYLGGVRDISVVAHSDGRVLALAGSGDGVQVIDVTDPYHPAPAGGLRAGSGGLDPDGAHRTAALHSDGRVLALVAGGDGRTVMLDITSPGTPALAGAIPTGGAGSATAVSMFEASDGRPYAMLAGEGGVQIVDVTDPGAPVQAVALEGFGVSDISIFESSDGRLHAMLAGEGGVRIIYLDDPVRYYAGIPP